ncbi:MAG: hypothetical protein WBM86_14950 [Waterburya sp.]
MIELKRRAIAREVKLFINLLQTGEIGSLSDLLQQAGYSNPTLLNLTSLDDIVMYNHHNTKVSRDYE